MFGGSVVREDIDVMELFRWIGVGFSFLGVVGEVGVRFMLRCVS